MKSSELKKIIKEAVKEAIQEELKEILLEAVKGPKIQSASPVQPSPVVESIKPPTPTMTAEQKRAAYQNILGDTAASFTSQDAPTFRPTPGFDTTNGTLPQGNVGMDQIMGLMNK